MTTSPNQLLWWITLWVSMIALLTTIRARRPRQVDVTLNGRRMAWFGTAMAVSVCAGLMVGRFPEMPAIPLAALALTLALESFFFETVQPIATVFTTANASRAISPLSLLRRDRNSHSGSAARSDFCTAYPSQFGLWLSFPTR
ncbi:hypothetical protein [Micromonospora sp. CPCC 206061]|uniref:hypothetical protein n=1 Tax=Micromonospora sp. CPCC 206061 TaxID=3122410 RepID=UPI002FF24B76